MLWSGLRKSGVASRTPASAKTEPESAALPAEGSKRPAPSAPTDPRPYTDPLQELAAVCQADLGYRHENWPLEAAVLPSSVADAVAEVRLVARIRGDLQVLGLRLRAGARPTGVACTVAEAQPSNLVVCADYAARRCWWALSVRGQTTCAEVVLEGDRLAPELRAAARLAGERGPRPIATVLDSTFRALERLAREQAAGGRRDEILDARTYLVRNVAPKNAHEKSGGDALLDELCTYPLKPVPNSSKEKSRRQPGPNERAAYERLRGQLALRHMRLTFKEAKKRSAGAHSMTFEELVTEGYIGLCKAIDRFDPRRGHAFSTYATHWVRQSIARAVRNTDRLIRVPSHVAWEGLPPELKRRPLSLSDCNGDTVDGFLSLRVARERADAELKFLEHQEERQEVEAVLDTLRPRQQHVLRGRFGLGCVPRTLEEIGRALGLSRERVRQIEGQAITKLRKRIGMSAVQRDTTRRTASIRTEDGQRLQTRSRGLPRFRSRLESEGAATDTSALLRPPTLLRSTLEAAGIRTVRALAAASLPELLSRPHVGAKKARLLIELWKRARANVSTNGRTACEPAR